MADTAVEIRINGQSWNGQILGQFANNVGTTLTELGQEYDDMIEAFEAQKAQLRNFAPTNLTIAEEGNKNQLPSPSPNQTPTKKKKRRSLSSAGIQSSIRAARDTLRRKLSSSSLRTRYKQPVVKRREVYSMCSLSRDESEYSDVYGDESDASPRKHAPAL